jgi:hypothetical protein
VPKYYLSRAEGEASCAVRAIVLLRVSAEDERGNGKKKKEQVERRDGECVGKKEGGC